MEHFGMISETEYLGLPPSIAFGSHALRYENLVSGPVITFVGTVNLPYLVVFVLISMIFSS